MEPEYTLEIMTKEHIGMISVLLKTEACLIFDFLIKLVFVSLSLYYIIVCSYWFCEILAVANIGVFWNMDESPIPEGLDPTVVKEFLKSALEYLGYRGSLIKVWAYCEDSSKLVSYCDAAGVSLQNRGELHFLFFGFL